jgi:excisionase family DNA binding protein
MARHLSLIAFPDGAPTVAPDAAAVVPSTLQVPDDTPARRRSADARLSFVGHRYLDARGAASYLSLTKKALYHRVSRRSIPYIRVGRLLRFDRDALDRWMRRGSVDSGRASVAGCAKVQTPRAIAA